MKINITLLLLIISSSVFSQVDDTKLKKYKELYDKGLIDSIEYKSLKKNALFVNNSELDSIRNQKYQEGLERSKTGAILMGVGIVQGVGALIYWNRGVPSYPVFPANSTPQYQLNRINEYGSKLDKYKSNRTAMIAFSSLFFLASTTVFISGTISKEVYHDKAVSIELVPNGFVLNF
jgi:hypothetical protein